MNTGDAEPLWTRGTTPPLCPIPWLGRFVVLSAGHANFCCYSSTSVGNVNERPLREIWRGPEMRHIRAELSAGRLPVACQSTSCPIYRGDERNYVLGTTADSSPRRTRRDDWPEAVRGGLSGVPQVTLAGQAFPVDLWFDGPGGHAIHGDLFLAIQAPGGGFRFLPDDVPYSLPVARGLTIPLGGGRWSRRLCDVVPGATPGTHRLCVAVVEAGADPNDRTKCYWTLTSEFTVS